jgi:hypothetical protein
MENTMHKSIVITGFAALILMNITLMAKDTGREWLETLKTDIGINWEEIVLTEGVLL